MTKFAIPKAEADSIVERLRACAEFTQIEKDYERLRDLDFFDAPARAEVERLREVIGMRKRPSEHPRRPARKALDVRTLQGLTT